MNKYNVYNEYMRFDGDIIITDPCYVVKYDDWDKCCMGSRMGNLPHINNSLVARTLYGDWSCTTYDISVRPEKEIGKFCADAGLVGVFLMDELRKYDPSFNGNIELLDAATIIRDFHGDVMLYKSDGYEPYVEVHGNGNINFVGCQTGL